MIAWQVIVNENNAHDTQELISKRLSAIKNQRSTGELEDLALIIGNLALPTLSLFVTHLLADGKSLGFALEKEISKLFLELAIMCKAVICCKSFVMISHTSD
jgi:phospholipid-transporting ATPase